MNFVNIVLMCVPCNATQEEKGGTMYQAHGNTTIQTDPYEDAVYLAGKCRDCGGLMFRCFDTGQFAYWDYAIPECLHTDVIDIESLRQAE
jgi:hypothetical protein